MIESDPEIMGGEPVMKGTRIPVTTILCRLAAGDTIETLHQDYPYLERASLEALSNALEDLKGLTKGDHPAGCLCTRCRVEGFGTKHV